VSCLRNWLPLADPSSVHGPGGGSANR
jgi:hypothetical protein